jgi:hypothetical protein
MDNTREITTLTVLHGVRNETPNEIATMTRQSIEEYLACLACDKMPRGESITLEDYLKRLDLLTKAKFFVVEYFLAEPSVSERFRINFKLRNYRQFDPSFFNETRWVRMPVRPCEKKREGKRIPVKCQTLTPFQKYNKILKRFIYYSNFLKENPEFGKQPVKLAREQLKLAREQLKRVSKMKNKDPSVQEIAATVMDKIVRQQVDLSTIHFKNLIDFILSCLDFKKPYESLPPEEASQKVETDTNNIRNLLCLAIVSSLSSTFTKSDTCGIANTVFNQHIIGSLKHGRSLSRSEMSRTKVHYDNTNCMDCCGCDDINTVLKYGEYFKIVATGIERILLFTSLGEYNSFFSFLMFLCQINRQFCLTTTATENFQEIPKFLKVIFGLHFHYLPDLDVLIDRYYVDYHRHNVLSKSYTVDDLLSQLHVRIELFRMLEDLKNHHDSKASERKSQSKLRQSRVNEGRSTDEEKTGLRWNHPQLLHVLTGGQLY